MFTGMLTAHCSWGTKRLDLPLITYRELMQFFIPFGLVQRQLKGPCAAAAAGETVTADLYEDEGQLKGGGALVGLLVASSKHLHG